MNDEYRDILRKGYDEFARFVNPLIYNRARMAEEPIDIVGTTGGIPRRSDGTLIEDFHGTQMLRHRREEITDAVRTYLDSDIPTWWPSRVAPFSGRFARRLFERTGYDNSFFGMSGADAVEATIKLSRALTRRPKVLGLSGGYHGCTMGACALMDDGPFKDQFAPHLTGVESVPFGDVRALEQAFAGGDVGALVLEPIQGEGGVRKLPDAFVQAACELTREHDALLVSDEVQTGLGRTGLGFLYATEAWPRRPDVVIIAKALGGGLVPLSAMLTSEEIFKKAYGKHFASGESHNMTFGFNTLGAVAGLATLDLITDEVIEMVRVKGASFRKNLAESLEGNPLFKEVRGEGMMVGIALESPELPWLSFEHFGFKELEDQPIIAPLLCHRLYSRGYFCFSCGHDWSVFRIQPRYDIPEDKLAGFTKIVREELDHLASVAF